MFSIDEFYSRFGAAIANRVTGVVVEAGVILELNPLIGVKGRRQGTRHRLIAEYPYRIVYRVKATVVQIVRVRHQSCKYFNLFFDAKALASERPHGGSRPEPAPDFHRFRTGDRQ